MVCAEPFILPCLVAQQKIHSSWNRSCPARSLGQPVQNPGSGPQGSPPSGQARRPPASGSGCAGAPCGRPYPHLPTIQGGTYHDSNYPRFSLHPLWSLRQSLQPWRYQNGTERGGEAYPQGFLCLLPVLPGLPLGLPRHPTGRSLTLLKIFPENVSHFPRMNRL